MRESYKLQLKDFIPITGFLEYISRNNSPEKILIHNKRENRELILKLYNYYFTSAALGGAYQGLEAILK